MITLLAIARSYDKAEAQATLTAWCEGREKGHRVLPFSYKEPFPTLSQALEEAEYVCAESPDDEGRTVYNVATRIHHDCSARGECNRCEEELCCGCPQTAAIWVDTGELTCRDCFGREEDEESRSNPDDLDRLERLWNAE